jgi:glyoxylase-like metal-dependent hydrolase (beta-lactamase superfamily II)
MLASALYWLYTSRVGPLIHRAQLAAASSAVPHTDGSVTFADASSPFVVVTYAYLSDNYGYLLIDKASGGVAIIDGADAGRAAAHVALLTDMHAACTGTGAASGGVGPGGLTGDERAFLLGWTQGGVAALREALLGCGAPPVVRAIIATHGHQDHAGGNAALAALFPAAAVLSGAPAEAPPPPPFILGGTTITFTPVPCHTRDSALVVATPTAGAGGSEDGGGGEGAPAPVALFAGDTLFVAGVGKFFEGTASEMEAIIAGPLAALPAHALLFPGHEYAADNLAFTTWLEPGHAAAAAAAAWAASRAAIRQPAAPTTLAEARSYNPFLRAHSGEVKAAVARALGGSGSGDGALLSDAVTLAALRELKNEKAHKQGK